MEENKDQQNSTNSVPESKKKSKNALLSSLKNSANCTVSNIKLKIESYEIQEINPLNTNKKLLVISYERVLALHPSDFSQYKLLPMDDFLSKMNLHYNIIVWSSSSMETLTQQLNNLGILDNSNYDIAFCLDREASVCMPPLQPVEIKPLNLIWTKYPAFSPRNTVAVGSAEDFKLNGRSVVKVDQFDHSNLGVWQLTKLARYLESIAKEADFTSLDHTKWDESRNAHDTQPEKKEIETAGTYEIQEVNLMIGGKKLLLLNLDGTVSVSQYDYVTQDILQDFLTTVYPKYHIAIWTQSSLQTIMHRARMLRLNYNTNFKVSFYLEYRPANPMSFEDLRVKVLNVVANTYRKYSAKDTIILDDRRCNVMGLAYGFPKMLIEFENFAEYLNLIGDFEYFQLLNHDTWRSFKIEEHRERLLCLERIVKLSLPCLTAKPSPTSTLVDLSELDTDLIQNPADLEEILAETIRTYRIVRKFPLREDAKLLVLDLDGILGDTTDGKPGLHRRPYLEKFLLDTSTEYDIAVWCSCSAETVDKKLQRLSTRRVNLKSRISLVLDQYATIPVLTKEHGVVNVKPLQVIWRNYPQFSAKNTIMIDDEPLHFLLNPKSGLRISRFPDGVYKRHLDQELVKLSKYLQLMVEVGDFTVLNHDNWRVYPEVYYGPKAFDTFRATLDAIFGCRLGRRIGTCIGISSTEDLRKRFGKDYMKSLEECLDKQCRDGENVIERVVKEYHAEVAAEKSDKVPTAPVATFSVTIKFKDDRQTIGNVHRDTTQAELKRRIHKETIFNLPPRSQRILYPVEACGTVQYRANTLGDGATLGDMGVEADAELQLVKNARSRRRGK